MGLAIARGIVQAHGGKIWIEDGSERKGTSVQFTVPLDEAASRQISSKDVPQNSNVTTPGSSHVVTPGENS